MASRFIAARGRDVLVCGLQWHPLVERKKRKREILGHVANSDAAKIVVLERDDVAAVGLCPPMEDEDTINGEGGEPIKPRHLFSAAALLGGWLAGASAVFALTMPDKARTAVIVIVAGVPMLDEIKPIESAQELVLGYVTGNVDGMEYPLYTNDLGSFQAGNLVDLDDIWGASGKQGELVGKPVNYSALTTTALLILLIAGGVIGWQHHVKKKKLEEAIRRQKEADPRPQYDAALAAQQGALGWTGGDLVKLLDALDREPIYVEGWTLKAISCKADAGVCVAEWNREGGTTDQLVSARAAFGETPLADSTRNKVFLTWKPAQAMTGITSPLSLPTIQDWAAGATSMMQIWENAGIQMSASAEGFSLWPNLPNVPPTAVPAGEGVRAMSTQFSASEELTREALRTEPPNYYWRELALEVGSTVADPMKLQLKGFIYAR
jgi:hypothetical protein